MEIHSELNIKLRAYIDKVISLARESEKSLTVFSLGNTRINTDSKFYLTPIRTYNNTVVSGIIVFSEEEASECIDLIDGVFDVVLVDSEKKSIKPSNKVHLYNLERLAKEKLTKSKIVFYKGNDLTVDSIELLIRSYFDRTSELIGGKNIVILGIGNIGFKISLRLVELGANVYLKSRSERKAKHLATTINLVKPFETLAKAFWNEPNQNTKIHAIVMTSCSSVNLNEYDNFINERTLILDVGKGCIPSMDVKTLYAEYNITPIRLDIGDALERFTVGHALHEKTSNRPLNRVNLANDITIIDYGIVGLKNEIVVDNSTNPKRIYGVCDGKGFFYDKSQKELIELLKEIKKYI